MKFLRYILFLISCIRLVPHLLVLMVHAKSDVIHYDVTRWISIKNMVAGKWYGFCYLMTYFPEYRNLFYYRIGAVSRLINFLCPHVNTLFLYTPQIGPGLFIQRGFATIVAAQSIGKDCWINQQVTIGYNDKLEAPVIGDGVFVYAGAKVIGSVHVGNNVTIGANAVVVKDVPANCTVVGVPAYIVKRDGIKVNQSL